MSSEPLSRQTSSEPNSQTLQVASPEDYYALDGRRRRDEPDRRQDLKDFVKELDNRTIDQLQPRQRSHTSRLISALLAEDCSVLNDLQQQRFHNPRSSTAPPAQGYPMLNALQQQRFYTPPSNPIQPAQDHAMLNDLRQQQQLSTPTSTPKRSDANQPRGDMDAEARKRLEENYLQKGRAFVPPWYWMTAPLFAILAMVIAFIYLKPSNPSPVAQLKSIPFGDLIRPPSPDTPSAIVKISERLLNVPNVLPSMQFKGPSLIDALGDCAMRISNISAAVSDINQKLTRDLPCLLKDYELPDRNRPASRASRTTLAANLTSISADCYILGNQTKSLQPLLKTIIAAYHAYNSDLTKVYQDLMREDSLRRTFHVFNLTRILPERFGSYQKQVERNCQARSEVQPEIVVLDTASSDLGKTAKSALQICYDLDKLTKRVSGGDPALSSSSSLDISATSQDWYWQFARKYGFEEHAQLADLQFEFWWDRLVC